MPLYHHIKPALRANLEAIQRGDKARVISIGELTDDQFNEIRRLQELAGLHLLESKDILFMGKHLYNSRSKDGYSIDDMITQIESSLSANSRVSLGRGTTLENPIARIDGYGNTVNDRAVLEMTSRRPKSELFSVMPKNDDIKPSTNNGPANAA